ncbi:uncharacterized protein C8R40DRAFT_1065267 [Lentinula edodes]|uniref:uncharacterized protein n=1 Tax=Lentinula edodes TaxID=5353 RepID=UPI001E8D4FE4|nr:uncharacterized protein C8R40DRAFT_1065267 [Lentinula edodes]KAH7881635.1 hypothetical protein C8R40DRAFT_1065267 [Lentinula edodes]
MYLLFPLSLTLLHLRLFAALLSDIWIARLARIPRYTNVALWELEKGNGKADHMSPEKEETTRVAEFFFPEFWPTRLNESLLGLIWSDEGDRRPSQVPLLQGKPLEVS